MANVIPKIIVGIDPSFSHCGVAIIDNYHKTIQTYDVQTALGKQNFYNICVKSKEQVNNIVGTITKEIVDSLDTVIGMENALPHAFSATALTALDVLLFYALGQDKVALFNPTYLSYIMGKHTKKDSINLAKGLLSIFASNGYAHTKQAGKKLTDGEAEAFIYACRMFCRTMQNNSIKDNILELQPLFSDEKETCSSSFIY